MIGFIIFGILIGTAVSTAQREFALREVIGFSMLGIGGALYGNFLATLVDSYLLESNIFLSPLLISGMALLFTSIKILLLRRQRNITSHH